MVMTDELTLRGRLFQVTSSNEHWAGAMRTSSSGPTWRLSVVDKTSLRSRKSLGGVRIGSIPPRQMEALDEVRRVAMTPPVDLADGRGALGRSFAATHR